MIGFSFRDKVSGVHLLYVHASSRNNLVHPFGVLLNDILLLFRTNI
jgi:hypothetical protein